jgi:peptidase M1-like protein
MRTAARFLTIAFALAASPATADPLPAHADKVVDYAISVRLDDEKKELSGSERVVWRNPSSEPVGDLCFHLYLNGFRDRQSTFYRESGGHLRDDSAAPDGWGWIDVTALALADGRDLLKGLVFEHPDDDNEKDRTVARIQLPEPVPPGGEVALDIDFHDHLPKVYARTGYDGEFFAVAQWFPKLAVYEPAGMRGRGSGAWNCHQFHAHSEFYADFGNYKVEITAPSRFRIGATGVRMSERHDADGTSTYVYEQSDIHDFAWAADPDFVEIRDRFVAEREVTPAEYAEAARRLDRTLDEVKLGDIDILLYLQPDHLAQRERHLRALKLAIKSFGLWYGRYPYPFITVIDPEASGASGVEYPTLIFNGTEVLWQHWPFEGVREPEITLVHEFAHQYWYGLVANNEFEEAWLDEGFATYSEDQAMDAGWGGMVELLGLRIGGVEAERLRNDSTRTLDPPRRFAWQYSPGQYGFYSYSRPALVLHTLRGVVGDETMARILRTYHERWRFRHPRGEDFYDVASEVAGRDLRGFFDQTMERKGVFDPAVARLSSEREEGKGSSSTYRSVIDLKQRGEISLPVEVELAFDGAAPERRTWEGERRWVRWELERPGRLLWVKIDPDQKLALDVDRLNNARRLDPDRRATAKTSATALFWLQQLFGLLGL